ncbi:MAG: hypothetical protein H7250_00665 [Flavobacterium sp.]|nr:hypothetical protein [Flavobacterium sp.]
MRFYIQKEIYIFTVVFFLGQMVLTSQTTEEKIIKITTDYFELTRENFHLQFNKTTYLAGETTWFKGFVLDKKTNLPSAETTNVYLDFLNAEGNKMETNLLYAENGFFEGNFELNEKLQSGIYYFRVYTNFSNNFTENEAGIFKIEIINPLDEKFETDENNLEITFQPESNVFLEGVKNTIGISILNCKKESVTIGDGKVLNEKGEEISSFQTNIFGFGKFEIINATSDQYKVSFTYKNEILEKILPKAKQNGLVLSVNNFSNDAQTYVNVIGNDVSIKKFRSKNLYLTINQNDKISVAKFEIKSKENPIIVLKDNMFQGINILRIIDENLNQICERIVFNPIENQDEISFEIVKKDKDSIQIKGITNLKNGNFGISVLPQNNQKNEIRTSIFQSFLLDIYLSDNFLNGNYFFDSPSKRKYFDLDILLLNQKTSKYEWENMKNPPKKLFDFEYGLTITGKLNMDLKNKSDYQVRLFSFFAQMTEFANINENNSFKFVNLIIKKGGFLNLTLTKSYEQEALGLKYYAKVVQSSKGFEKPFLIKQNYCKTKKKAVEPNFSVPKISKNVIYLDDVNLKQDLYKLKRKTLVGNSNLYGHKIDSTEMNNHLVLDYIRRVGFQVVLNNMNGDAVQIFSRLNTSITGPKPVPLIEIDGQQMFNFNELNGMTMDELDEIYTSTTAMIPSMSNHIGIIKMYRSKFASRIKARIAPFSVNYGFEAYKPFKNSLYTSTDDEGFKNFGVINWIPKINNENNVFFYFKIPDMNQKTVKILIEGMSKSGEFISTVKEIQLE